MKIQNFQHTIVFIIFLFNSSYAEDVCLEKQPENSYCDSQKNCEYCNTQGCLTCSSDLENCDSCKQNEFLYENKCVQIKPPNAYCDNQNKCTKCDPNCLTCDSSTSSCSTCPTGQYLINNKCQTSSDGLFCDNYICSKCINLTCKTCDRDLNTCLTCQSSQFLLNECLNQPPPNSYCDEQKKCSSCKAGCQTCSSDLNCVSCKQGEFLYESRCVQIKPSDAYCDSKNECKKCSPNCLTCDSGISSCSTCPTGQYLINEKCQTSSDGLFCDNYICSKCINQTCKTCDRELKTCLTCQSTQFLLNDCLDFPPPNSNCDSQKKCQSCNVSGCQTCSSDLLNCDSCKQNEFLYENKCVQIKPPNAYCDNQNKCTKCDPNCLTCDSSTSSCSTCPTGQYLINNKCQTSSDGLFCDNYICSKCINLTCKTCDRDLNTCLTCQSSQFLLNECLNQPPPNSYCDEQKKCSSCKAGCQTCSSDLNCVSCKQGEFLYESRCVQIKPSDAYCDSKNECKKCSPNCLTCDSGISSCSTCPTRQYLINEKCQTSSDGLFCDNYICSKCTNLTCKTCDRDLITCLTKCNSNCLTCESDLKSCISCNPGYYLSKNECIKCSDKMNGCFECDNQQQCKSCLELNFFLFENKCSQDQPDGTICNKLNRICQACGVENCSKCDIDQTKCEQCKQEFIASGDKCVLNNNNKQGCPKNQFSYNNTCVSIAPENTYCNQQTMECQQCKSDKCFECEQDLQTCKKCMSNTFEYEMNCYDKQPKKSYCEQDVSSSNNIQKCYKCHEKCNECIGPGELGCQKSSLSSIILPETVLSYKSSFSNNDIIEIHKSGEVASMIQFDSSLSLSLTKSVVTQASTGLLLAGLSCQKLSYSILIKTKIPAQVLAPLKATSAQIPSQKMKFLNILNLIKNSEQYSEKNYFNAKFESVNLEYNILQNCGQGITIFFICLFLYLIFLIGIEKIKQPKINSISKTIYNKLVCSLVIQYFCLLVSMFAIGVNSQILEFINEEDIDNLSIKIVFVVVLVAITIIIFFRLYYYLNFQESQINNLSFNEITREKIQNETIFQSKIRRNFMLIYLFSESVLIPTIFIQFNQNYIICLTLAIITQLGMLAIIFLLMPFLSKLTNLYFIIDSILWIAFYIQYFMINYYSSQDDVNQYSQTLDNISYSILFNLHLILMANPVYLVLTVILKVVDIIKAKLQQKQEKEKLLQCSSEVSIEINGSDQITNAIAKFHSKKRL